jgi:methyltransferase family protein
MEAFEREFSLVRGVRVLDVGGTPRNWAILDPEAEIVLLNVYDVGEQSLPPNITCVQGDGTALGFGDDEFDVCFSNSTIEHVHSLEHQRAFASEVRRVGRGLWLQTPARSFPFEPHWLGFFIHWLPKHWQRRLARNFTVWGLVNRPNQEQVDLHVDEYRLLDYREMRELFPDCEIRRERFLGLTKSYVAVRRA